MCVQRTHSITHFQTPFPHERNEGRSPKSWSITITDLCVTVEHAEVWDEHWDGEGDNEDAAQGAKGADNQASICFRNLG